MIDKSERSDKKQQILDTALHLFAAKGFHATSIQDIAEAVGIAKGSVYLHFKSKEDLLISALKHTVSNMIEAVAEAASDPALTPRERLIRKISRQFRFGNEHKAFLIMILNEGMVQVNDDLKSFMNELRVRTTAAALGDVEAIYGERLNVYAPDAVVMLQALISHYSGLLILNQLNIDKTPLLGAAGVLGLAIGFASQTSVSNVISGIFLIAEKSFEVGEVITVGNTTGTVLSIDTLSVKLRTFDNRFIRIPNETMIKSELINISRFPIRRADIMVGVAYKEDIERVKGLLADIALKNPNVLNDPAPLFIFQAFGASSIDIQFSVWALKDNWLDVKNEMYQAIKERFDAESVEIPFPHISIYKGEATDPMPIQLLAPLDKSTESSETVDKS